MATIQITDENFDNEIKKNKVLVCDFWASGVDHVTDRTYT